AIARHTNAFKINEDVVIPLARLGDYTDAIERINIECSLDNKLELARELELLLSRPPPLAAAQEANDTDQRPSEELLSEKLISARALVSEVRGRWQWLSEHLDLDLAQALPQLERLGYAPSLATASPRAARAQDGRLFDLLQDRTLRVSWKRELRAP